MCTNVLCRQNVLYRKPLPCNGMLSDKAKRRSHDPEKLKNSGNVAALKRAGLHQKMHARLPAADPGDCSAATVLASRIQQDQLP